MQKAIILGGTHDHITLIELLKQRGYYTILIDYYENPIAKKHADEFIRESTTDKETVLDIAKNRNVDFVIAICVESAIETMAYVSEKMNTPCYLSYQRALWFTNKAYMKNKMLENKIPTSNFKVFPKGFDFKEIQHEFIYPSVIKPVDSNSSNGISKVNNSSELENAIALAHKHSKLGEVLIEEFIDGEEFSAEFFFRNGKPQLIVTTKTFKTKIHDNKFLILNSMSPAGLNEKEIFDLTSIVKKIGEAFEIIDGPLFIQFLITEKGINIIEFSSRIGGGSRHHFVFHSTGFDYLEYLLSFSLNEKLYPIEIKNNNNHFGCHFVYASPGKFKALHGLKSFENNKNLKGVYLYKNPNSIVVGNESSSHRVFGFIVEAEDFLSLTKVVNTVDNKLEIRNENDEDLMLHNLYYKT